MLAAGLDLCQVVMHMELLHKVQGSVQQRSCVLWSCASQDAFRDDSMSNYGPHRP